MKILNRKQFLAMPAKTLYREYNSTCNTGKLHIKEGTCGSNDYCLNTLNELDVDDSEEHLDMELQMEEGKEVNPDFYLISSDSMYDDDARYLVYTKEEIKQLITVLSECI